MTSNSDIILISDVKDKLKKENTFEENIKVAMHEAKNNWLVVDPNDQFRGAVGALGLFYGEGTEEFERIKQEMKVLNSLSVMGSIPVDFQALSDNLDTNLKPCELRKIWDEAK
ncbi:hypothetical protein LCGC14_0586590 [marine sediment metagenome]|uniref:Uncharacterized protein n=1 Tax=marine sediment metagenome TaxID=412755 RepID=A0A0F9UN68_9ZZZZ